MIYSDVNIIYSDVKPWPGDAKNGPGSGMPAPPLHTRVIEDVTCRLLLYYQMDVW